MGDEIHRCRRRAAEIGVKDDCLPGTDEYGVYQLWLYCRINILCQGHPLIAKSREDKPRTDTPPHPVPLPEGERGHQRWGVLGRVG